MRGGGGGGGRGGGQRLLVQMICSAQHGGVACYSAELRLCSAVLQHLEFEGRGQRGVYSHVPFFSGQMVRGETRMCWWGGFDRNKKERSYIQPQPTCVGMWKVRCTQNIQEVAAEHRTLQFSLCFYFLHVTDISGTILTFPILFSVGTQSLHTVLYRSFARV